MYVKQQEGRIGHLERALKAAREEICKLKAVNVISNFMEQNNAGNWKKPKKFQLWVHRFTANDASQVQLKNKSCILSTDALEVGQQTPVLLKHKGRELKLFTVKTGK
jgi:hypothetical protein